MTHGERLILIIEYTPGTTLQSRLDYFLVNNIILEQTVSCNIKPGYRSDHSLVEWCLTINSQPKGPGTWKFNNSLLRDEEYCNQIKHLITETLNDYRDINEPPNTPEFQNYSINDQLLFELLKTTIRGKTIAYATSKKKLFKEQEKKLDQEIDYFHLKYSENPTEENLNNLTEVQNQLQILRESKIEGIMLRAKAKWNLEGEKNTKYFCNLEKKHYQEKTISKLITDEGEELTNINQILKEQARFYENLYTSNRPTLTDQDKALFFPENKTIRQLTEPEADSLEIPLTTLECWNVLKNIKGNKSPGYDGFTAEFYVHFWDAIKFPMLRSFQDSYSKGSLSNSQKLGMITCLPKPGKEREYMKNWRPISLLNVDYKILSGVIANRMKTFLDQLVSEHQKGFINGRYIGECTRLVSDIFYKMRNSKISGVFLLIDFEKAFDSLEFSFLDRTLKYFNFGENIRKWVNIFYTDPESCIINNGHCSGRFNLSRGVRQGDPLSPYLFILATEILTNAIINHKDINGIKIDNSEYLISLLADDTTLLLDGKEESFRATFDLLERFAKISGLKINYNKTVAIRIGLNEGVEYRLGEGKNIKWQSLGKFTLLGINYDLDEEDITATNYTSKSKEFMKILNLWNTRNLTIYGKVCIIKSLALSKLVHLFSSIPNPPENILKQLQSACFKFIWNNGSEKIQRTTMYNDYRNGGFRVPNLLTFSMAQKLVWIKKLLDDNNESDWKTLFLEGTQNIGDNYIWLVNNPNPPFLKKLNPFWQDVYKAWQLFSKQSNIEMPHTQHLFYNENIKIGNRSIYYKEWQKKGIEYINDLLDETGQLLNWQNFSDRFNIENQIFYYTSVIHSIPKTWKNEIKNHNVKLNAVKNKCLIILKNLKKPSRYFYLEKNEETATEPHKSKEKWMKVTEKVLPEDHWKKLFELPKRLTKETKLIELQQKIIHRILPTNKWLFKCNLSDTVTCSFCHTETESIEHLFWECITSKNIWLKLGVWLKDLNPNNNIPNLIDATLGNPNLPTYISHLYLITRQFLYQSKLNKTIPNFNGLLNIIRHKIKVEKLYLNNYHFGRKWDPEFLNKLNLI